MAFKRSFLQAKEPRPKKLIGLVGALLCALLSASPATVQAQQGTTLPGLAGGQLAPADLAQGTHIVVVWASWSPRCRDIAPRVNQLAKKFAGQAQVVTVDFQEEKAAVEEFVRQHPFDVAIYLDRDGEFSKGHAVTTLPGLIVVRKGEVLFQGRLAADADAQVQDLLH
ncbi:MAG: TlpA disulfide reductase family protein [Thermoanaerobaculia bacterium]